MEWELEMKKDSRKDKLYPRWLSYWLCQGHLRQLHRAIQGKGQLWATSCGPLPVAWSWLNSYKNRYGLIELNLETQERIIRNKVIGLLKN